MNAVAHQRPKVGTARQLAVAVLLCLTVVALPGRAVASVRSDAAAAVWMVNEARASYGVGPVQPDPELRAVAQRWAEQMAANGYISHNWNLGNELSWGWWAWAENVGYGPSVGWVQGAFMNSPRHAENILQPAYGYIGVGVAYGANGAVYVAQVFGAW